MTSEEEKFLEELTALCHKHKMYLGGLEGVHINKLEKYEDDFKWFMDKYGTIYFDRKEYP